MFALLCLVFWIIAGYSSALILIIFDSYTVTLGDLILCVYGAVVAPLPISILAWFFLRWLWNKLIKISERYEHIVLWRKK